MHPAPTRSVSAVFTPVRTGSLVDQIIDRITEAAESGLLRPGQRLPNEVEFAASLGVSPLTIREALSHLRTAQIVVTTRGRTGGSFISPDLAPCVERSQTRLRETTRVDLVEITAHVEALASGCARAATRRAGGRDIAALRTFVAAADDDPAAWRRVETDFLIEMAATGRIARLARALMAAHAELGVLSFLPNTDPAFRSSAAELRTGVVDAIASRNQAAAEDAVRALTDHTASWLLVRHAELVAAS